MVLNEMMHIGEFLGQQLMARIGCLFDSPLEQFPTSLKQLADTKTSTKNGKQGGGSDAGATNPCC